MALTERRLLALVTHISQRYALAVVLALVLLTCAAFQYTVSNIGINTDTGDMIAEDLAWRQDYLRYKQAFPQYSNLIAIVIDAPTPDQVQDAALALSTALQENTTQFEWVSAGANDPFFRQQGLLYLDIDELESLADQLAEMQPFMARLQADPSLRGLFQLLTEALDASNDSDNIDLEKIFTAISETLGQRNESGTPPMSWQALLSSREIQTSDLRTVLLAKPVLDFNQLLPGKDALFAVRDTVKRLGLENNGLQVRLTGSIALSYEELDTVSRGAQQAGLLSLLMVAVVLIIGLRSLWLVTATLVSLISGLILTACFAALVIGELNMISVAFAVLYIGLGADFAIHYCLRYREFIRHGLEKTRALDATSMDVGSALTLCAFTTAIGFFAFIPTAYRGVAELGLISGTGMFISLTLSLSLLPALLRLMPDIQVAAQRPISTGILRWPQQHGLLIKRLSMLLACVAVLVLPMLSFDHNPLNLQDQTTESVQTFHDLMADADTAPWSMVTLVDTEQQATALTEQLEQLTTVAEVIRLKDFVPQNQEDKAYVLEDLRFSLGEMPGAGKPDPSIKTDEQLAALASFRDALSDYADNPTPRLLTALNSLLAGLDNLQPDTRSAAIQSLQDNLLKSLPGRLNNLAVSLQAEPFGIEDIPQRISQRWISDQQQIRLEIRPAEDLNNNVEMERFVNEVLSIAPHATDTPVIHVRSSEAVVTAFKQAFSYALIVIALLLVFLLDKKRDVLLVLYPLLLAGALTGAVSILLDMPMNFANIIALPLLLGIGVDSGIHIVHRYRFAPPRDGNLLGTSTARGVLFSALTTVCSFGNLAISPHTGTASMGMILTIGLVFTLISTLLVLPALLSLSDNKPSP